MKIRQFAAAGLTLFSLFSISSAEAQIVPGIDQNWRRHAQQSRANMLRQSIFPSGTYFRGGEYGPDVNFPIPVDEENNPGAGQCIDRNA